MKKTILTLIVLGTSLQSHAGYLDIIEKQADQVQGASECNYSVIQGSINENTPQEFVIFLHSDEQSHASASIRLSPEMIPLKEGVIISRNGQVVEYKDGVLTQTKTEVSEGPFVNDYSVVKIKVSPDLREVEAGYIKKATKGLIREIVESEMSCRFLSR